MGQRGFLKRSVVKIKNDFGGRGQIGEGDPRESRIIDKFLKKRVIIGFRFVLSKYQLHTGQGNTYTNYHMTLASSSSYAGVFRHDISSIDLFRIHRKGTFLRTYLMNGPSS